MTAIRHAQAAATTFVNDVALAIALVVIGRVLKVQPFFRVRRTRITVHRTCSLGTADWGRSSRKFAETSRVLGSSSS